MLPRAEKVQLNYLLKANSQVTRQAKVISRRQFKQANKSSQRGTQMLDRDLRNKEGGEVNWNDSGREQCENGGKYYKPGERVSSQGKWSLPFKSASTANNCRYVKIPLNLLDLLVNYVKVCRGKKTKKNASMKHAAGDTSVSLSLQVAVFVFIQRHFEEKCFI